MKQHMKKSECTSTKSDRAAIGAALTGAQDYWQYVFGNERPKPTLNKGAGLDVSPAVRDYLGLKESSYRCHSDA
jgi:hypothetical protein